MKRQLLFIFTISLVLTEDLKWGEAEDEHVVVLNKDNFDSFLEKNPKVFVKFYAPWCGHCKAMAPGYSKLAERMKNNDDGTPIAKVDATVEKELSERFQIQGFPTLKLFINGEPIDYKEAREEDAMYDWIMNKNSPTTTELLTQEDLDNFSTKKLSVLLVLPQDDNEVLKKFMTLSLNYEDVSFAHTFSNDLKKSLEVTQKYAFVVFRDFDDGKKFLVLDELNDMNGFKSFFEAVRFPVVMDFDQQAAERIFGSQSDAMIYFSDSKDSGYETFKEFANANTDKNLLFSYSMITQDLGARLSEFIGITDKDTGAVRIINFNGQALDKFVVDGSSVESLTQGVQDYKDGKLNAYYKSQPVPETNSEPVKVVVGDTFEEMVLNSDKFVLLEAYAPWCGHCQQLEPIYKELAEELSSVEDLVVTKIDATANEHPSLNIEGFPTLKLYKPGTSEPVDYQGDRSLDDLVQFLEKELDRKLVEKEGLKDEEL